MRSRLVLIGKCLYVGMTLTLFFNIFMSSELPWKEKYLAFGVPANSWPGGDSRNIQMAAYCESLGLKENQAECIKSGGPVKNLYPEANIPLLNYPSLVVDTFAIFSNYSEAFFMRFWQLNVLMLIATIFALSWLYDLKILPFLIFNPIVLLAVERGNTDAMVFSLIFIPLLLFRKSVFFRIFFLGLATAFKIFPVFAYIALTLFHRRKNLLSAMLGVGLSAPLVVFTMLQLPKIIAGTPKGFSYAYGFLSLLYVPVAKLPTSAANIYPWVAYLGLAIFAIFSVWALICMSKIWSSKADLNQFISQFSQTDLILLVVSLSIFLSTFWFFVSFAYRLVFLIPIFLVMKKSQFFPVIFLRFLILFVLWIPVIPFGWVLVNLLCYPLALGLSFFAMRLVVLHGNSHVYPFDATLSDGCIKSLS
jgi:hypothetical protein